jgi:hypothetical protein
MASSSIASCPNPRRHWPASNPGISSIARIINRAHPGYGVFLTLDGIDHGFSRALSQNDSFKNFRKPDREYNPVFLDALRDWASKVVRE